MNKSFKSVNALLEILSRHDPKYGVPRGFPDEFADAPAVNWLRDRITPKAFTDWMMDILRELTTEKVLPENHWAYTVSIPKSAESNYCPATMSELYRLPTLLLPSTVIEWLVSLSKEVIIPTKLREDFIPLFQSATESIVGHTPVDDNIDETIKFVQYLKEAIELRTVGGFNVYNDAWAEILGISAVRALPGVLNELETLHAGIAEIIETKSDKITIEDMIREIGVIGDMSPMIIRSVIDNIRHTEAKRIVPIVWAICHARQSSRYVSIADPSKLKPIPLDFYSEIN